MGKLGLCLSGGGFRATFFHLGVIRFLRESGLLKDIEHITSVSGGSILAAHLVLNWDRYVGTDSDFRAASSDVVNFCRQDIRGRIVRRWLGTFGIGGLFRRTSRVNLLQFYLSRLYCNADLESLRRSPENCRPRLYILTTSMTTGHYGWFSSDGFSVEQEGKVNTYSATLLPVSLAVAASTAFPPLFPPLMLRREDVNSSAREFPFDCEFLADGGIFDNVGIRHYHHLEARTGSVVEWLICSDASAALDWNPGYRYSFLPSRTVRATDIMMKRIADLEDERLRTKSNVIRIAIHDQVSREEFPCALRVDLQRKAAKIRTDLDLFSDVEISTLVHHGYEIAHKQFCNIHCLENISFNSPCPDSMWSPCTSPRALSDEDKAKLLEESGTTRLRLWSARDYLSWLLVALAIFTTLTLFLFLHDDFEQLEHLAKRVRQMAPLNSGKTDTVDEVKEMLAHLGASKKSQALDLHRISANRVKLPYAHFEHAILWGSDFKEADLEHAMLREADLGGTDFTEANLSFADLSRTLFWESDIEEPLRASSLKKAILTGANLEKAILTKANLQEAHLEGAFLKRAYLLNADLTGAHLQGADLTGANLSGARQSIGYAHPALLQLVSRQPVRHG